MRRIFDKYYNTYIFEDFDNNVIQYKSSNSNYRKLKWNILEMCKKIHDKIFNKGRVIGNSYILSERF